jgi:hypothetical protein
MCEKKHYNDELEGDIFDYYSLPCNPLSFLLLIQNQQTLYLHIVALSTTTNRMNYQRM